MEKIYTTHFQFPANIENKDKIKKQKDIQEKTNYDNLKALNEEIIKERNKYNNL